MRIYTKSSDPNLATGVVGHLISVIDSERSDVWLISPWLRDVDLPIANVGHFASVFGGHRERVALSELLARIAQVHVLHMITKPPAELVPLSVVRRLVDLLRTRESVVTDAELQGYETVDGAVAALNDAANALASQATQHSETIELAWQLRNEGCELFFLDRLHAKVLWSPAGALLGSANFTNGGFAANEELMIELSTENEHRELGQAVEEFRARSVAADSYELAADLRRARVTADDFRAWPRELEAFGNDRLTGLLERLAVFVA